MLAGEAGVSRVYLARLEFGRLDPSLTTLLTLAKALQMKVGDRWSSLNDGLPGCPPRGSHIQ